jgi:hypothetical protein
VNGSEYVAHALEAERRAQASQSAEERAAYERIASVWRELAASAGVEAEVSATDAAEATPQRATAKSQ